MDLLYFGYCLFLLIVSGFTRLWICFTLDIVYLDTICASSRVDFLYIGSLHPEVDSLIVRLSEYLDMDICVNGHLTHHRI